MKRVGPLVQLTMALVALASTLVILATLFLDVIPDRDGPTRQAREAVAEALAVQLAERLVRDDAASIETTLRHLVSRTSDLRSVGVRRADGQLAVDSGNHVQHWVDGTGDRSRPEQVTVPLIAGQERWGRIELAFAANDAHPVVAFFQQPLVHLLAFMTVGGWIVFGLYMRRALQHLDPSTVVPERVQGAFDAMAEGVVVLDAKARVMMCNKAFRGLDDTLSSMNLGGYVAALPWLAGSLPADPSTHPWSRAMSERAANSGTALEVGEGHATRRVVVNAAPIADAGGAVRGCLVTFADVTALHRANEALQEAMTQLRVSKQEVEQKNAELERLATRDPLTGVMNRRAFQNAFERLAQSAREAGQSLACLMIDIDHFKAVNDTHGHGIGDRVIQEVARRLQDSVRGTDLVCRWGGEEFCIVTFGLDAQGVADFGERVRRRIEREAGAAVREVAGLRVTCSVGVARSRAGDDALAPMVDRADQALYEAKRSGRNRVEWARGDRPATAATPADHVDASGWLNARGWAAAYERLLSQARADDRTLTCVVAAVDVPEPPGHGSPGSPHGADPGSPGGGDPARDAQAADEVRALVARSLYEAAPHRAAATHLPDGSLALLVAGWNLADATDFAHALRQRVLAAMPGAAAATRVCVGVDALPARAPAAWMLQQRASQALARVRRDPANSGVGVFAASNPRGASGANASSSGTGADPS